MNFSRQDVADACRRHCVDVPLELCAGYDPARLLWAIAGNESSFGANCAPRHEPAYDTGGSYAEDPKQAALLAKFGRAGACSYGPLQVLLVNAPNGMTPEDFDDLNKAIAAGVFALKTLLERNHPNSLAQIGACYNGGHVPKGFWAPALREYAEKLIRNYCSASMPEPVLRG